MNAVFFIICALSLIILSAVNPDSALPSMLSGANKALAFTFTLVPAYSVWTGLYKILETSGLSSSMAKKLARPVRFLFGKTSDKATEYLSLNLAANMLGLGGVATPLGIKACEELERTNAPAAAELLLVLASTSVQLLPTSVLALMISYGSENYLSIILPGLIATSASTAFGIVLFKIADRARRIKKLRFSPTKEEIFSTRGKTKPHPTAAKTERTATSPARKGAAN